MVPQIDSFLPDDEFPTETSVVIIGGGIVGVSAALYLSLANIPVLLCEKGVIGGEQSGRNQGWVRVTNRDPREIPLALKSLELWREINELVQCETGFRQAGTLYATYSDEALSGRDAWLSIAKDFGVHPNVLNGTAVRQFVPNSTATFAGAVHNPNDGRAEPQLAAPAIARGAQRYGAKIFTGCAALDVDRKGGRVAGIRTERGYVKCDSVVLAGGAWSGLFARSLGLRLPQLKIHSSVMQITAVPNGPEINFSTPNYLLRKRIDGGYTLAASENHAADVVPDSFRYFSEFLPILRRRWNSLPVRFGHPFFRELSHNQWRPSKESSPYENIRTLDPPPRKAQNIEAKKKLDIDFPVFKNAQIQQHWAGYVDVMPDEIPVISSVEEIPGLIVATGFSGHGFGVGPGAGKLIADLVQNKAPIVDPTPFRFSRYEDGTWRRSPNYR